MLEQFSLEPLTLKSSSSTAADGRACNRHVNLIKPLGYNLHPGSEVLLHFLPPRNNQTQCPGTKSFTERLGFFRPGPDQHLANKSGHLRLKMSRAVHGVSFGADMAITLALTQTENIRKKVDPVRPREGMTLYTAHALKFPGANGLKTRSEDIYFMKWNFPFSPHRRPDIESCQRQAVKMRFGFGIPTVFVPESPTQLTTPGIHQQNSETDFINFTKSKLTSTRCQASAFATVFGPLSSCKFPLIGSLLKFY
ncbi:hypothetical protein D9757_014505 [Collybiopsis confluens]|uniref:Uncharacterized protein n=1 Tax=Collybiopsis confluens TaxID=2823264 RepID=A0A8H5G5V8_9AGAR|nr:hypothetical protein D9757_014505 [Collybiopsis confluens]